MIIADIIKDLENIAPTDLAVDGDRIGLQVGDRNSDVRRICVSLDTTDHIINSAIERNADILVAHHPLIYSPLTSVSEDTPVNRRLAHLIRSNTALYVMHTNFDAAPGGTNDVIAEMLGVLDPDPLMPNTQDSVYKIVVFVPESHVSAVRDMMADAGAGRIGQYTHCSFRSQGLGSFVPLPPAQPYIGDIGKLEEVNEYRLEMVCLGSWLADVIAAMIEKHPYDEVAYDIYELANEPVLYGLGRVGTLKKPTTLDNFAKLVQEVLTPKYLKVEGDPKKKIRRVAICTGSGSSHFRDAIRAHADVYITGDTKYHDILDANSLGLAIIDAGHFDTEAPAMRSLAERLMKMYSGSGVEVEYIE